MIYTNDNITFNNVLSGMVSSGTGGPLTAKTKYRVDENGNLIHRNSDYLVNAIDIHWGDILVDERVITSTEDLINWILVVKDYVPTAVSQQFVAIANELNTFVTKTYADDTYETKELANQEHQLINDRIIEIVNIINENFENIYSKQEVNELIAALSLNYQTIDQANADKQELNEAITNITNSKANSEDVYTQEESDAKYLTEHQSLTDYATKEYVGEKIAEVVGEAPETLDTLKEIADALADNATMSDIATAISTKANSEDVYTKEESDAKYLTEHQDISGKANVGDSYTKDESDAKYLTEHQDITGKANAADVYTKAEADERFLTEHQDITGKANVGDSYTKEESDAKYLTEHQSLENYATISDISNKVDWTESTPGRNHIVLKNHDSILGTGTDGVSTYNVAMVSKWDVADFGSNQIHLNLNTVDNVTINDNKVIVTND